MLKKSIRKQKLNKHKSDKTNKKSKDKILSEKNISPAKSIPSLNLTFLSNNTNQLYTTPPSSPKKQHVLKHSLSDDSSLSFDIHRKADGPKSLGMVRTKPLANFQYPNNNIVESDSENSNNESRKSFKK